MQAALSRTASRRYSDYNQDSSSILSANCSARTSGSASFRSPLACTASAAWGNLTIRPATTSTNVSHQVNSMSGCAVYVPSPL
ncbi:hypothetical protein BU25DRAFT_71558 [Macroventuria anomochaeta]|uniref:Uncharacterized protein n=1 Tax=Macroventuria anomochaeta TaxID=301207 RepID=A0ACB6RYA0_9PLEO|nr:uncharacterized protein BU25DRAFT_71558 [Macroventuria anomochaeta]KAF2626748.1 hypothetical protein BU25DRAFT_71558 [Macroventuria anomochaeta]